MGKAQFASVRESPKGMRILKWLRRKPQPFKVIGETDEGEEVTCALGTGKSMRPWTDAVRVLIDCVHLTAVNEAGETIRVLPFADDDPTLQTEDERAESRDAKQSANGSVPLISIDVPKLVDNIARNIRDAVRESASMQSEAHTAGFTAMVSVVNLALGLLVRLDQRLEVAQTDAETAAAAAAANQLPPGDNRDQLAMMALQKVLGGGGAAMQGLNIDPTQMQALGELFQRMQQAQPGHQSNGVSNGA